MDRLSFFWLHPEHKTHLKTIETDFFRRISRSLKTTPFLLGASLEVTQKLHKLCREPYSTQSEITATVMEDILFTATVVATANASFIHLKEEPPCYDIHWAVSELGPKGILQLLDKAPQALSISDPVLNKACKAFLVEKTQLSYEFASTMALVCSRLKHNSEENQHLDVEQAFLIGLLANIGVHNAIKSYTAYCKEGHYLDFDIAREVFETVSKETSHLILKKWHYDTDFIQVSSHCPQVTSEDGIRYLDIAKMATHLLMFKKKDAHLSEHDLELTLEGAEAMYDLCNLKETEFRQQIKDVLEGLNL